VTKRRKENRQYGTNLWITNTSAYTTNKGGPKENDNEGRAQTGIDIPSRPIFLHMDITRSSGNNQSPAFLSYNTDGTENGASNESSICRENVLPSRCNRAIAQQQ
jgi:hypothetical protein